VRDGKVRRHGALTNLGFEHKNPKFVSADTLDAILNVDDGSYLVPGIESWGERTLVNSRVLSDRSIYDEQSYFPSPGGK